MFRKSKNKTAAVDPIYYLTVDKRVIFYLFILLGVYWLINLYRPILSSLVLGILLAYLLHPLVVFFTTKLHLNRGLSVGIVFVSFIILIIAATRFSTPIILRQINILTTDFDQISNELIGLQPVLDDLFNINVPLENIIPELENELAQFLDPSKLFRIILAATGNLIWVMITFMTCLYTLLDHSKLIDWIYHITPETMKDHVRKVHGEIELVWRTYLRGQLSLMLLIGFVSAICGVAVGLKSALIIGLIAGILELIPSLGPTIAAFIAAINAWTQGSQVLDISNLWFTLIVCGIFILIQLLENTVIVPRIMSRRMKLHPALIFIAVVSTLALFGVLAGLIVIPVIGSVVVIINYIFKQLNATPGEHIMQGIVEKVSKT